MIKARSATYRKGVFLDGHKVRQAHLEYLLAIDSLSASFLKAPVTSKAVTDHLHRAKSGVESLRTMETLGYISYGKSGWEISPLGEEILIFSLVEVS